MESETVVLVSRIWREVLGVETIEPTDDFFELGGHSLLGSQVLARLGKETGARLPLHLFKECPTLESFGHAVDAQVRAEGR
ncbi:MULTISPECIES: phosphopantetheine-binding protein [unclassified Streptomyces]|uniref:phosphopantetheine-binding protein n=1 Tax=unclassified Streptomyces TaxID=2593676 RepID=UPI0034510969